MNSDRLNISGNASSSQTVPMEESVAVFGCGVEWAAFVPFGVSLRVANWRVKQLGGVYTDDKMLPPLPRTRF
jgi:hypothetical protein